MLRNKILFSPHCAQFHWFLRLHVIIPLHNVGQNSPYARTQSQRSAYEIQALLAGIKTKYCILCFYFFLINPNHILRPLKHEANKKFSFFLENRFRIYWILETFVHSNVRHIFCFKHITMKLYSIWRDKFQRSGDVKVIKTSYKGHT